MADNYTQVMAEVDRRVASLVQKGLTEIDATSQVFRDDRELYHAYARISSIGPERTAPSPRRTEVLTGAQAEVMRRGEALAKSAGLSLNDAVAKVLRDDPQLYVHYAKGDSMPAPSFGTELLGHTFDLYGYYSALSSTLQGILASDAGDKGAKIATALDDFKGAVLAQVRQAGLSVPTSTEKRASDMARFIPEALQVEVLKTAGHLAEGNYAQGLRYLTNTLREIRGIG